MSVVALGFGMNIHTVFQAGKASLLFTGCGIILGMLLAFLIGRVLHVSTNASVLVGVGTAICGGSAIAAVAPIIEAKDDETAVSLSTVFLLNALALILFPAIAASLGLSQIQFGLWAAMAIHDTSSVVGAGLRFGSEELTTATAVKLVRALWDSPGHASYGAHPKNPQADHGAMVHRLFVCAAWARTLWPGANSIWIWCAAAARTALAGTLFLIGSSLSRRALAQIGWRVLGLAVILWIIVASISLALIRAAWIHH
jgi:uncharacterized membrane protein YadS